MILADYIAQRNEIHMDAEEISKEIATECWGDLEIVNRNIERMQGGQFNSLLVEKEIQECFSRVKKKFNL